MKKLVYIFFVFGLVTKSFGQDAEFTQFNSVPLYLNPAFTGSNKGQRFAAAYRNQWPGVGKSYTSYLVSYDNNLSNYNSGLGAYVMQDQAGTSNLTNTQLGLNYSYSIRINNDTKLKAGLQGCLNQKKYLLNQLVFNDQLITGAATSIDASNSASSVQYFDAGTGLLLESKLYWLGVSVRHMNQPNVSLRGGTELLPMLVGVQGGYRFEIEKPESVDGDSKQYVGLLLNYRHQGVNDQLDVGASYFYKVINFTVWYRGLPFKSYKVGYQTRESVAFMLAYQPVGKSIKIGYSYDVTISSLNLKNSGGAHEITLIYDIAKAKAVRKSREVIGKSMKF